MTARAPSPTAEATRLTDCGADVAGHEHPGDAGLQQVRVAVQVPARRALAAADQVGPGDHEAAAVADERVGQPVGQRGRADEDEQVPGVDDLAAPPSTSTKVTQLQPVLALAASSTVVFSRTSMLSIAAIWSIR